MKLLEKCKKWIPVWEILPLISILAVNCVVYWGSSVLTADRYHFDFTFAFDRSVPLIPEFVWIYILAFPFWAVNYILAARRGKKSFYRFVATDLLVHLTCFIVFMAVPTTNIRPVITGDTLSERVLSLVYIMDGGDAFESSSLYSLLCELALLERIKRCQGNSGVVSEIFSGVCGTYYYFYTGIEAALYCGCHCSSYSCRSRVAIFCERKSLSEDNEYF